MNTVNQIVAQNIRLANDVIGSADVIASEGLHTAGWALVPQYQKRDTVTTYLKAVLFMDWVQGKILLEHAAMVTDMITGKPLYVTDDIIRGTTRIVHKENPFFDIATNKLTGALEIEPLRTALSKLKIPLRKLDQLVDAKAARVKHKLLQEALKPALLASRAIIETLAVGEKRMQERSLAKIFADTPFDCGLSIESRKHLTIEVVEATIRSYTKLRESLRATAYDALKPITDFKTAKKVLKAPGAAYAIEQLAIWEARRLHNQRFWLAFAFTVGDVQARVTNVSPDLLALATALEKDADPISRIGYYDQYDFDPTDRRAEYTAQVNGDTPEAMDAQVRVIEQDIAAGEFTASMEELIEIMQGDLEDGDDYYDEGQKIAAQPFRGAADTFEDVLANGLIPVSYNKANAVETKIVKLRERKSALEMMARAIGKRADDGDWVVECSDWSLLEAKENAFKLMLPSQAEKDADLTVYLDPTTVLVEAERASALVNSNKRFF
jgi:hypothetical protein